MTDTPLPSPAHERILVCVEGGDPGHTLIRAGAKLAQQLQARWTALYDEESDSAQTASERDRIAASQRLVAALGGEVMVLPGASRFDEVLAHARAAATTQIVVGQPARPKSLQPWRSSLARQLVAESAAIPVHVIPSEDAGQRPIVALPALPRLHVDARGIAVSATLVALVTILGTALRPIMEISGIVPIYLAVVLFAAVRYGMVCSLVAATLGTVSLDFFFFPPLYHFDIADPRDSLALSCFASVAIITSRLSTRLRAEMLVARRRARTTAQLYAFSRSLAEISAREELLPTITTQVGGMFGARALLLLWQGGNLVPCTSEPTGLNLDAEALRRARVASDGAETAHDSRELMLPLRTGPETVGVLWLRRDPPHPPLGTEEQRLIHVLADQAAAAIERIRLATEIEQTRVLRETERLSTALLTSVSHDLRTPLATILAAIAGLRDEGVGAANSAQAELLDMVQEQSERLNRFVGNLLDITRVEGGVIAPRREPADLSDIVGSAVGRASGLLARHRLVIDLAADLPMVDVDFVLMEQVFFNLLDNAAKYAPAGSTVSISGRLSQGSTVLEIADEGSGIAESELERIFSKFHRLEAGDHQRPGTGLGLAICRGFVEAHGGTIIARNRIDRRGAIFIITLPLRQSTPVTNPPPSPAAVPTADRGSAADSPRQAQ